ncbi:MAG: glycosyltransferase [Victivallales bacterium]|nr:glycosyltransferase [Victivallales bacterium]
MSITAIVVPCYNEGSRLRDSDFLEFLSGRQGIDMYFVNDGSRDNTLQLLNDMAAKSQHAHVVDLKTNRGKAFAVYSGFKVAMKSDYDHIGFWDADLATDLRTIPEFSEFLDVHAEFDIVTGCRVQRLGADIKRHVSRHYLGRVFATLISMVLDLPVYDTQCGAKLFRNNTDLASVFANPFKTKWVFDVEILSRYKKIRAGRGEDIANAVYEFPLDQWHDVDGSKVGFLDGILALADLLKIKLG